MAEPATSRKREQSEQSRERLIDAATRLFAERGYRDASVQAIGEAAGISRGSILWPFGSQEGPLWGRAQRAFARREAATLLPAGPQARAQEGVAGVGRGVRCGGGGVRGGGVGRSGGGGARRGPRGGGGCPRPASASAPACAAA